MNQFIRNDQYNFIKQQVRNLVKGHATGNDSDVIVALESLVLERILELFEEITEEQKQLLVPVLNVEDKEAAERFLSQIKKYVIAYPTVTEGSIKKIFPKVKKLSVPDLEEIDLAGTSYLGWNDKGSNRKYLIVPTQNKLVGLWGTFRSINKKGICAICHHNEEVGMFMSEAKSSSRDIHIKRGNYICVDSKKCNENITALDKLHGFIGLFD